MPVRSEENVRGARHWKENVLSGRKRERGLQSARNTACFLLLLLLLLLLTFSLFAGTRTSSYETDSYGIYMYSQPQSAHTKTPLGGARLDTPSLLKLSRGATAELYMDTIVTSKVPSEHWSVLLSGYLNIVLSSKVQEDKKIYQCCKITSWSMLYVGFYTIQQQIGLPLFPWLSFLLFFYFTFCTVLLIDLLFEIRLE